MQIPEIGSLWVRFRNSEGKEIQNPSVLIEIVAYTWPHVSFIYTRPKKIKALSPESESEPAVPSEPLIHIEAYVNFIEIFKPYTPTTKQQRGRPRKVSTKDPAKMTPKQKKIELAKLALELAVYFSQRTEPS